MARGPGEGTTLLPLLADLMAIPTGGRYPPLALSAEARKARTLGGLVDRLVELARARPVLAIVEDAHWIDPTTQELLELAATRLDGLPALLLITLRPTAGVAAPALPGADEMLLGPLEQASCRDVVSRLTAGKALPDELLQRIMAQTEGVPPFVEELTRTVLASHLETALAMLRRVAPAERELDALARLSGALRATRGYAAPEIGRVCRQALELAQELRGDTSQLQALNGLSFHLVRSEYALASEAAKSLSRWRCGRASPPTR